MSNKSTPIIKYTQQMCLEDFPIKVHNIVSEYKCPLCFGIVFDPVADSCGHIFCNQCFIVYSLSNKICPIDQKTILDFNASKNQMVFVANILNKQPIMCRNRIRGCPWLEKLKDYPNHLKFCLKELIRCDISGCTEHITRDNTALHLKNCEFRKVSCDDCQFEFPFKKMKDHEVICPKKLIKCEFNCGEMVIREDLRNHFKTVCLEAKVSCPFIKIGCEINLKKRDLNKHIEDNLIDHTLKSYKEILNTRKRYFLLLSTLECRLQDLEQKQQNEMEMNSMIIFDEKYENSRNRMNAFNKVLQMKRERDNQSL